MSRTKLDALLARRDEVQASHAAAVARLEQQGPDHAVGNRTVCGELYDELAALQRRIDAMIARERAGGGA